MSAPKQSFLSGVRHLMTGQAIGQVVGILGLLLLLRLYSPEAMGRWALFMSIGCLIPLLAGLRYDLAIVLVQDINHSQRLTVLVLLSTLVFGMFMCALALFSSAWHTEFGSFPYATYLWLYGLYTFGIGLTNAGIALATREGRYRLIMANRMVTALLTIVLQSLFFYVGWVYTGLIAGSVLASLATGGLLTLAHIRRYRALLTEAFSTPGYMGSLRRLAIKYKNYPLYALPYSALGQIYIQVVLFALGIWYSVATVGWFNLALRTIYAPLMLVANSISQIFMPKLGQVKEKPQEMQFIILSVVRVMGWLCLPAVMLVVVEGRSLYAVLFGENWRLAGTYAGWLTLAVFGAAITLWMERIFDAIGRQRLHFWLSTTLNLQCLLLFALAHFLWDDATSTIAAWSFGMLLYALIWLATVFRVCGFALSTLIPVMLEYIGVGLVLATLFLAVRWVMPDIWLELATMAALSLAYYALARRWLKSNLDVILRLHDA